VARRIFVWTNQIALFLLQIAERFVLAYTAHRAYIQRPVLVRVGAAKNMRTRVHVAHFGALAHFILCASRSSLA